MKKFFICSILHGSERRSKFAISTYQEVPIRIFSTEKWLYDYHYDQFFRLFRMKRRTLFKIVEALGRMDHNKILSKPYTGGHVPIDIVGRVLIFLWYMASQDTLITIGTVFHVSQKICNENCKQSVILGDSFKEEVYKASLYT